MLKKIIVFIIALLINVVIISFLKYINQWNLISYVFGIIFEAIAYFLYEIADIY